MKNIVVTGGNGFIGHHLTNYLKEKGNWVRAVDWKPLEYGKSDADETDILDLRYQQNALTALRPNNRQPIDEVYTLAADMGGMGFISKYHSQILGNNLRINLNTIEAAKQMGIKKYFFSSSACVYPEFLQEVLEVKLKEEDAYPAQPQDAYGWEKLVTERLIQHYADEFGIDTRIARFHNIYGPEGTFEGGREKAPAALSRKIAFTPTGGTIDIWGDGKQTRSFCYIDDCCELIYRLMESDFKQPLNIGRDDMISIDDLANLIANIAGKKIKINHIEGPQGVRGRNSDNTLARKVLEYEAPTDMRTGLTKTYWWIEEQLRKQKRID